MDGFWGKYRLYLAQQLPEEKKNTKAARGEMISGAHNGFYIRNYFYFLNNNYKIMDGLSQNGSNSSE